MKYRVATPLVEAIQWTVTNEHEVARFAGASMGSVEKGRLRIVVKSTGESDFGITLQRGDWLVKREVDSSLWVKTDEDFRRDYTPMPD